MNELPLRKIFSFIDGKSSGPDQHSGPIGRHIHKCLDLPVIEFQQYDIPHSFNQYPNHCNDLYTDQMYLRDIILAISCGTVFERLAKRSPSKMGYARWLTTSYRILRLCVNV